MFKIRVLIVDDSVIVRSRLCKVLITVPEIELADIAANGSIALAKIPLINPDVVILDVEMPEMNGLETLVAIRKSYPNLAVIMFSTFTVLGAMATLDALTLGANDYATKPSNLGSTEAVNQYILEELVPKIKIFAKKPFPASSPISSKPDVEKILSKSPSESSPVIPEVVAIGVSTGGPNALAKILPAFPADFPVPILIVQHMPPLFTKLLAQRLNSKCQIQVEEATSGTILSPGKAWIAPGDFHILVERDGNNVRIVTSQSPPANSCRPAVDVLFASIAQVYKNKSLGVVLTGMGQDGLLGCECIHAAGGQIIAQDEESSVIWGMPGFVVNAGLTTDAIALGQMADEILQRLHYDSSKYFL